MSYQVSEYADRIPTEGSDDLPWSTAANFPKPLPVEVLEPVLSFLATPDISRCTGVNKAWYLVAKPRLFMQVNLDSSLHLAGPGHPTIDLNVGTRPLFRRGWMTRHCIHLSIEAHSRSSLLCCHFISPPSAKYVTPKAFEGSPGCVMSSLPKLPRLETVVMPNDPHFGFGGGFENACGFHNLRGFRHLVLRDVAVLLPPVPSSFPFGSIEELTLLAAPQWGQLFGVDSLARWHRILRQGKRKGSVTYVHPHHTFACLPAIPLHPPLTIDFGLQPSNYWERTQCFHPDNCKHTPFLNAALAVVAACVSCRWPPVRFVGFEDLAMDTEDEVWVQWHFALITRELVTAFAENLNDPKIRGVLNCARTFKHNLFSLMPRREWGATAGGSAALGQATQNRTWAPVVEQV